MKIINNKKNSYINNKVKKKYIKKPELTIKQIKS